MSSQRPSPSLAKPPHWPPNVYYISTPCYHSSVPPEVLAQIRPMFATSGSGRAPRSAVIIQRISDPAHPAKGQHGLFAAKKIPPRTHILDYTGEVHGDDRPGSDYDLSLFRSPDGNNVGVDASHMGNEARFVNDYRGVKPRPNALFQERKTESGELRMSVWSGSECIRKGDEILVSYGKSWWQARSMELAEESMI
ncbi:SET domain protein [Obba rivulosa]|uniref:SET domain protein n=1 Tax=Obba rivulosa TaxID=1052685 RepID=A0A8E2DVZ3_9APHY|nr:SET domain protein [Obba rivulosa]